MASGSQSMTTYYAKRIVGDASAAQANSALLQTGANVTANTWILNRTNRADTYGIKYVYDTTTTTIHNDENDEDITTNNGQDKIEFYGGSATASAWIQLNTGDTYISGRMAIGGINDSYKLYVNGSARIDSLLTLYREGSTTDNNGTGIQFENKDTTTNQIQTAGKTYILAYNTHSADDNGMNMVIRPGGNLFIGSGESAEHLYGLNTTSTTENLYATADSTIYLEAGAQTIANRIGIAIDDDGTIVPVKAEANNNNAQNIGTNATRWKTGYFSTSLLVGAANGVTAYNSDATGSFIGAGTISSCLTAAGGGYYLYANGVQYGRMYISAVGTANSGDDYATRGAQGYTSLYLGNNISRPAAGTEGGADNSRGRIYLYHTDNTSTVIYSDSWNGHNLTIVGPTNDEANTTGDTWLILGNNKKKSAAEASTTGAIRIYGDEQYYHNIYSGSPTANRAHYLPNANGWIVTGGNGTSTGEGDSNTPVYLKTDGTLEAITSYDGNSATATALTSNAGGTEQPIYFTGGKPAATSYALKATVNNGDTNYVAYYSGARAISSSKASTVMIMPAHYYHNLYNNNPTTGTTVYVHYYNGDTTSTNTFANLRVKSGSSYKVLAFGGDGELTWNGTMTANGGYLKSTLNSNTVQIGSQNASYCHITNSANIPFWFNKSILMEQNTTIGNASTQYRPFQLYLGRYTTTASNDLNANNPLIEFSNSNRSQYCQLMYDDHDSVCAPDSLTLVGNQNGITFICKNGPIWVQGGSNAGGNINRLTTSSGMPGNMQYNTSRRGTQIYSNGIAFADPYNGNSNNDAGWIRHQETTANTGELEIAVGDDGNETVVVRQYNTSNSAARTLTLLSKDGYAFFPSYINIGGHEKNAFSPTYVWGSNSSDSYLRSYQTSHLSVATAAKWTTARTITLTGSVTGSVSIDGSGNVSLATTTNHNHDSAYVNITGDTMSGVLHSSYKSGTWVNSLTNSVITLNDAAGSYGGWICGPTKNGRIAISTYQSSDDLLYIGYGERGRTSNSFVRSMTWNGANGRLTATSMANAIWNDIAESRVSDIQTPGYVIAPDSDKIAHITTKRLQPGGRIISDTYGYLLGDEDDKHAPVAIAGRVLAYPLHDKSYYRVGDTVCVAEGGKIDKMTREEIKEYPDRIIGIVNEIPDYDIWEPSRKEGGREPIHTNGRIWIDIR